MSIDYYQRQIEAHHRDIARLQEQKSRAAKDAAEESRRANTAEEAAARTNSASMLKSKLKEAQRHREAAVRHQKSLADLEGKIAREQTRLMDATKRLASAQADADRKRRSEMQRAERDHEQRMRNIATQLSKHESLHSVALAAIEKLQELPEQITVLFLAANPVDQPTLRLDEEARAIGEMIRKSEHRTAVKFESRWAMRPLDLLQALNELRPTVVHFSGHGSATEEIVFQDPDGRSKFVSKEAIAETMAAASGDIQLVVFNTCYSVTQAEAVVQHVPAAIGMTTGVGDPTAKVFSASFYSAVGFGLSVKRVFDQARAAIKLESLPGASTPELFVTPGLDPDELVLVKAPR